MTSQLSRLQDRRTWNLWRGKRSILGDVNSKKLLLFAVFIAVIFLALVPYVRFVVQRQGLDTDLARISLDYSTVGRKGFEQRVHQICRKARLEPGTYEIEITEDKKISSTELGWYFDRVKLPEGVHHYAVVFDNDRWAARETG